MCVSVRRAQASIRRGQAAAFTITVWTTKGASAPDVTVALTVAPASQNATFTSLCPTGNGESSCELGDVGTDITPASFQLVAQISVPSTATSVTSVTLTAATTTSPVVTSAATAADSVTVTAPPPKPKPTPSPRRSPTPRLTTQPPATARAPSTSAQHNTTSAPVIAPVPTPGATLPAGTPSASTVSSPGNVSGLLPSITSTAGISSAPPTTIASAPATGALAGQDVTANTSGLILGMKPVAAYIMAFLILTIFFFLLPGMLTAWRRRRRSRGRRVPAKPAPAPDPAPDGKSASTATLEPEKTPAAPSTSDPDRNHGHYLGSQAARSADRPRWTATPEIPVTTESAVTR
jgi:hypothetical protein